MVQNVEEIQHVSSKDDLTHPSNLTLSSFVSKLFVLGEKLSQDKHGFVNILDFNPSWLLLSSLFQKHIISVLSLLLLKKIPYRVLVCRVWFLRGGGYIGRVGF